MCLDACAFESQDAFCAFESQDAFCAFESQDVFCADLLLLDLQQLSDLVFFEKKLNPLFDFVHSFFLSTHSDSVVF